VKRKEIKKNTQYETLKEVNDREGVPTYESDDGEHYVKISESTFKFLVNRSEELSHIKIILAFDTELKEFFDESIKKIKDIMEGK